MPAPSRIEAFAIISADGMIAGAAGHMPAALKIEADQQFFHAGLDRAAVVVHGRRSHEGGRTDNGVHTMCRSDQPLNTCPSVAPTRRWSSVPLWPATNLVPVSCAAV